MFTQKLLSIFIILIIDSTLISSLQNGKVEYAHSEIDSNIKEIIWCGESSNILLAISDKNSLYQSDNKGFMWRKMNDLITHTGKTELEDNENEIGKVSKILLSPVDKNLVIFLGTHGINWVSQDCGRNVKALNAGRKIQEFIFHPTERNWGLASAFTLCEDFPGQPCKHFKELFVTKNLGESWDLIGSYVTQFSW
jgi:hypothetical protein